MTPLEAQEIAVRDQVWAHLKDERANIVRITVLGPQSARDIALVRAILHAVNAELILRARKTED